jgi:aspartyl-tRNA synthetase
VTQVVCNPEISAEAHDRADEVRPECVVGVEGEVVLRSADTVNPQISTGMVEVKARKLLVFNESKTPPFPIDDATKTSEETRLRYRYLDLRRGRMQRNLRLRHRASQLVRQHLCEQGFSEIETPFMTRSTPEGARDYLVPSRLHHGHFYALPQSPQLFKQILMIGGFDRYFQIVRCFRDEDLRADRQPEFTQVDIEMSFPQREVLFDIIERLMEKLFALVEVKVQRPFLRLTYELAMERYGSDKPHLGIDLTWKRIEMAGNPLANIRGFKAVKALRIPGGAGKITRSQMDKYQVPLKTLGAGNVATLELKDSEIQSRLSKAVGEECLRDIVSATGATPGDVVVLLGSEELSRLRLRQLDEASGWFRLELAERLELVRPGAWNFLWVIDFPMFEYDEREKRFAAMHHPFTSPREEDLEALENDPGSVKALGYDLVLNGSEIGGGSIRIHRQDIQRRVFSVLGLTEEKARERFGFFLEALEYGTPPHGGIALGYDRIIALMAGESNIREVIAFPKTASAVDLMSEAPAEVEPEQLQELGLEIKKEG